MGTSGLFRCEKCGFEAQLNFRQPDFGSPGKVSQYYCKRKHCVVWVEKGLHKHRKYLACNQCSTVSFSALIHKAKARCWFKAHPECHIGNLQKLELFPAAQENNIVYTCPREDCHGVMRNTGEKTIDWM